MLKVAVLFGGKSCENEISVLTGVFVLNLLDREKYVPVPVYIHTDGGMYTSAKMTDLNVFKKKEFSSFEQIFFDGGTMYAFNAAKTKVKNKGKIDGAINCCHGGLGEGGRNFGADAAQRNSPRLARTHGVGVCSWIKRSPNSSPRR